MSRELDAQVAEALGWTDVRWEEDKSLQAGGFLEGHNPKSTYAWCLVPHYSADMMSASPIEAELTTPKQRDAYKLALLSVMLEDRVEATPDKNGWLGFPSITPEQVCRAFLRMERGSDDTGT